MDWRVSAAIDIMRQELASPLTVGDIAGRVNLSASRFTHLFRHEMGCAPVRYLRQLRLDRARELVETSNLSIKEIMAAVGVNDPSHFTRDFVARHGAPPRRVRARARSPGFCSHLSPQNAAELQDRPKDNGYGQAIRADGLHSGSRRTQWGV